MAEKIAVIGSGMAGLAAAWLCKKAGQNVTVFESHHGRGMDAHTQEWLQNGKAAWVDVPLRVMSPDAWGSVLAISEAVGVETFPIDITVSCSWLDAKTWLRSRRLRFAGLDLLGIGSLRYLNMDTLRIAQGLFQLHRFSQTLREQEDNGETLAQAFERAGLHPLFTRGLILPLLSTICTCREEYLLAWPAKPLLTTLDTILHRRQLVRLKGGTRALVRGLAEGLTIHSGSPVLRVEESAAGVQVENGRGEGGLFDRVIVATQANQHSFLSPHQFLREKILLNSFTYDQGELFVHSDPSFMPAQPKDWVALNYFMNRQLTQSMFTVWVNAVEPSIQGGADVFQTWNPLHPPRQEHIIARVPMQRAVVTASSVRALAELRALHAAPGRRVFFCGSWAHPGVPLLESAVRSALEVTAQFKLTPPATMNREAFLEENQLQQQSWQAAPIG